MRKSISTIAFCLTSVCYLGAARAADAAVAPGAPAAEDQLEEVVVTAEKRSSTVQKTPISMTAISGAQLEEQGVLNIEDVARETPGISMRSAGPSQTEFEMRGLSSSAGSAPTVGFYLDETPLTPASNSPIGKAVIDPDLFDLNRVEVLRGPQGTLYGSGSMGGTIKLVTEQPRLDSFAGAADVSLSGTEGGGVNPGGNLMLNIPIIDGKVALRVVATDKYTSGWIDRIVVSPFPLPTNVGCAPTIFYGCARGNVASAPVVADFKNVNWAYERGGRATLLIEPIDDLSITATALYQRTTTGGFSQFDDPPGPDATLAHYQPYNQPEGVSDLFELYSMAINYNLGFAQLTSATAYWSRVENTLGDYSEAIQSTFFTPTFLPGLYAYQHDTSHQFSEELRLTSVGETRLRWLVGLFGSSFRSIANQHEQNTDTCFLSIGGCAANPAGIIYSGVNPYKTDQYALFGEGTYAITDRLKATVGVRWFDYIISFQDTQSGFEAPSGNAAVSAFSTDTQASGVNPKFTLSYSPDDDLNTYMTASKGFRPGGANIAVPAGPGEACYSSVRAIGLTQVPLTYGPDSVWNYEVGEKSRLLDGRVLVNSDVYYIDWSSIQQILPLSCGYPYTNNAGKAASYGPELELSVRLTSAFTVSVSGTYTKSYITRSDAPASLPTGSPVLNIPRYTENTSVTYRRPISGAFSLQARLANTFVGPSTDINYGYVPLPSYDLVNLRIGLVSEKWTQYFFIDNLTDKVAEITANNNAFTTPIPSLIRFTTNQPRTFGVELGYRF